MSSLGRAFSLRNSLSPPPPLSPPSPSLPFYLGVEGANSPPENFEFHRVAKTPPKGFWQCESRDFRQPWRSLTKDWTSAHEHRDVIETCKIFRRGLAAPPPRPSIFFILINRIFSANARRKELIFLRLRTWWARVWGHDENGHVTHREDTIHDDRQSYISCWRTGDIAHTWRTQIHDEHGQVTTCDDKVDDGRQSFLL